MAAPRSKNPPPMIVAGSGEGVESEVAASFGPFAVLLGRRPRSHRLRWDVGRDGGALVTRGDVQRSGERLDPVGQVLQTHARWASGGVETVAVVPDDHLEPAVGGGEPDAGPLCTCVLDGVLQRLDTAEVDRRLDRSREALRATEDVDAQRQPTGVCSECGGEALRLEKRWIQATGEVADVLQCPPGVVA